MQLSIVKRTEIYELSYILLHLIIIQFYNYILYNSNPRRIIKIQRIVKLLRKLNLHIILIHIFLFHFCKRVIREMTHLNKGYRLGHFIRIQLAKVPTMKCKHCCMNYYTVNCYYTKRSVRHSGAYAFICNLFLQYIIRF